MAISLYDASVASSLQTLGAVGGFLDKALAHVREHGGDPEAIVETRLFPDMHPFRFQVQSVVSHSRGALEAMRSGVFRPWMDRPAHDYAGLQALIAETREALARTTPEEVDALSGGEVAFEIGERRLLFTTEGFVLSFSLPNLHFHAATAYDILRMKGVPLGKRDFIGAARLKG